MHCGHPLVVVPFDSPENPLNTIVNSHQKQYLMSYLIGANVCSVLVEDNYFDRDYLDEFSAFYSKSARGYSNICKRLHFFSREISFRRVDAALSGYSQSCQYLQDGYLGFVVLRPIQSTPLGRTVLAWYANRDVHSMRVTPPLRDYTCNILGIRLKVKGIPWQQQDRGVSACATVALWSMFHSSAFDAHHSIPTTVEITKNALNGASGVREFPSIGLSLAQMREAIFAQHLTPKLISADRMGSANTTGFLPSTIASLCAANIRSGYPVIVVGEYTHMSLGQPHAICCIGFREKEQAVKESGSCTSMDDETEVFYIHDDNIGPNVRCRLVEEHGLGVFVTEPPNYVSESQVQPPEPFKLRPTILLIAVHDEIRMGAQALVSKGASMASDLSRLLNGIYEDNELPLPALSYSTQFLDVRKFYSEYLPAYFGSRSSLLGRVRKSIGRDARPLCLHIGLITIGFSDEYATRIMDIIYDTTDSILGQAVIAHIVYEENFKVILDVLKDSFPEDFASNFGVQIIGY